MKTFFSFVYKETLHVLRDPRTMLMVVAMPMVLMLLFGFAISMEVNNVNVMVMAPNHSPAEAEMVKRLNVNPTFTFKGYVSANDIDQVLRSGKTDAGVVFSPSLEHDLQLRAQGMDTPTPIEIIVDNSNTGTSASVTN